MRNALPNLKKEIAASKGRHLVLVLDFDGTLTRVRRRFEDVRLSKSMERSLCSLSKLKDVRVVILTGRTRPFMRKTFNVPGVEVIAERGVFLTREYRRNKSSITLMLGKMNSLLAPLTRKYGARVEKKEASTVFHVRNVASALKDAALQEAVEKAMSVRGVGRLFTPVYGRMTVEFQPKGLPDKGEAMEEIIKRYGSENMYVYIGDDEADEPAFKAVKKRGFGVLVRSKEKDYINTKAKYYLKGLAEVRNLLGLVYALKKNEGRG
ncbi:MAG: trehalose-phosphatase [Candidatus Altiarchaeales archaeon]|nr:trehalose-phosphatase [Candidatus Altiarchaeales archaeon]MBD3416802.1 trehalose-phosphatase [Candidatus Altiarchaeales archaeon]